MLNKPCTKTYCKHHSGNSPNMKRYKNICLHTKECIMQALAIQPNVINILDRPIKEGYQYLTQLTDDELTFCIHNESRKSGQAKLKTEKERREMDDCQSR